MSKLPNYQPKERWLLWRVVPGKLMVLLSATYMDAMAEEPAELRPKLLG
jgi:hypothetical protein